MKKCKVCGKPKGRNRVYCSNWCRHKPQKVFIFHLGMVLAAALLVFVIGSLIITSIADSVQKAENAECLKLQELEETHPDFYYTDWQKVMCNIK